MTEILIRPERPADHAGIGRLLEAAFGGPVERDLVVQLRAEGMLGLALVAEDAVGALLGMIAFPPLTLSGEGTAPKAVGLAPLTVRPDSQKRGIGSRLARAGLARCRAAGIELAIVLGEPTYYRRFGFSVEAARCLASPYAGEYCMALALRPGALGAGRWRVAYPAPFAALG